MRLLISSPIQLPALLDLMWSPIQQLPMLNLMYYKCYQNKDLTLITRSDSWLTPDPQHKCRVSNLYACMSLVVMLCNMDELYHF